MNADAGGGLRDFRVADFSGDIGSVEQDAIAVRRRLKSDRSRRGQRFQGRCVVRLNAAAQRLQREGAVHGTSFQVQQAEVSGEMFGDGAFARAGGPIDGDDGRKNRTAFAHSALLLPPSLSLRLRKGGFAPPGFPPGLAEPNFFGPPNFLPPAALPLNEPPPGLPLLKLDLPNEGLPDFEGPDLLKPGFEKPGFDEPAFPKAGREERGLSVPSFENFDAGREKPEPPAGLPFHAPPGRLGPSLDLALPDDGREKLRGRDSPAEPSSDLLRKNGRFS